MLKNTFVKSSKLSHLECNMTFSTLCHFLENAMILNNISIVSLVFFNTVSLLLLWRNYWDITKHNCFSSVIVLLFFEKDKANVLLPWRNYWECCKQDEINYDSQLYISIVSPVGKYNWDYLFSTMQAYFSFGEIIKILDTIKKQNKSEHFQEARWKIL